MIKNTLSIFAVLCLSAINGVSANTITKHSSIYTQTYLSLPLPNTTISDGLKEALSVGVTDGVAVLSKKNGFYKNEAIKILLPKEFNAVEKTLKSVGLGSLVEQTVKLMNRAAEDAVTEAGPIFLSAITSINFGDAANILFGGNTAATNYLEKDTSKSLVSKFEPKIAKSLSKVGADKAWEDMMTKYNTIARKNHVNENLSEYVTDETVKGLFHMIGDKEKHIRGDKSERTTPLLKTVFALQDNKLANPTTGTILKKIGK